MHSIEKIETARLIARKISKDDFERLHQLHANPTVMTTLGGVRTVQQTCDYLALNLTLWQQYGFGLWLWFDKANHHFVGRAGLRVVEIAGSKEVEVAYALVPEYWHKGIATEIAQACVEIAFEKLHLKKLICFTLVTHKASQRVMEKVGFTYLKEIIHTEVPHVFYELGAECYWKKAFIFEPLENEHLDLLVKWFDKPHVKEWWNDDLTPEQIKHKYGARIGSKSVQPYIVYFHEKPIGFIQYYYADKVDDDGCRFDATSGTVGIDQFIGDENSLNQGYGTQLIRQFINKLCANSAISKIITDVDANNIRAVRCYLKAGFKIVKEFNIADEHIFLMEVICGK